MSSAAITEIEKRLDELSLDEQLWLLERLASRVRQRAADKRKDLAADLAAMAADPDIQRELKAIDAEFRITEADGLETVEVG
jgi:hypothetical protein